MTKPADLDFSNSPIYDPTGEARSTKQRKEAAGATIEEGKAPYAGPEAAASVENLLLRNAELQHQLEKAQKGEPLPTEDKKRLETQVGAFERLNNAVNKFNPDYVGTIFDFPGNIENFAQAHLPWDVGTPGQNDFWQDIKSLDMMTRNEFFGASLTPSERQSYAETTITPGMNAKTALDNLRKRRDIAQAVAQRTVNGLREGGYRPGQINASLGNYVPDLNPRWMSAEQERVLGNYASSKDFKPEVYQKMLLDLGDANGLRLNPEQAAAAAKSVADQRAKGVTSFSGTAAYQAATPSEEKKDEAVAAAAGGGGAGDGGGAGGLGWGETLGGAVTNFIPDTVSELQGMANAVLHPINTATSVAQLGGGLLSMAGVGDFDQTTARALGQYYANKYGSMEGFKRELRDHPASILGDMSILLTGGAGAATKLGIPAKLTARIAKMGPAAVKAAEWTAAAARNTDPITALTTIVSKSAPAVVRGTGKLAGRVASDTLGTTTGAGGQAIREAANVGYGRSVAGEPTAQADAFLEAMRQPGANADDLVQLAQNGVANLRQQASQRYTEKMQQFGKNPVPLDITAVRKRIASIKPKSYDTWIDSKGPRPSSHLAWDTMNQFVDEYAYKASQDPSLLEPLAMDQFKQDLYDVGSKVGGQFDRDAARIAGTAYNAVKDELVKHDPLYASTMKEYEKAAREAKQLETTFSLAAARGKTPNIESSGRKLTSIFRNNVNTNFGSRTAQAERLSELDPTGTMFPMLAGQSLSSGLPRGIQGAVARAGAGTGITGLALDALPMALDVPGYISGYNLAALPLSSPRLMGEAAYYGGRAAGATSKALEPVTSRAATGVNWLAEKQKKYRTPLMAAGTAGMNIGAMQNPELQRMVDQYADEEQ